MKHIIYLVLIILILSSCSPQHRINRIVKRHPELAKQETKITQGVLTVPKLDFKATLKLSRDSAHYIDLLGRYVSAVNELKGIKTSSTSLSTIIQREAIISKQKEINRLQKEIEKSIVPDTTFNISQIQSFLFEDSTINIRTDVVINLNADSITYYYHRNPIKIPYKKAEITNKIDARIGKPFFKDWWFWLFLLMLIFTFRSIIFAFTSNQYNRIKTKLPWN